MFIVIVYLYVIYKEVQMDKICLITLNSNNEKVKTITTVDGLIAMWVKDFDIPMAEDEVIYCCIGNTQLHIKTFGELIQILTGETECDSKK